MHGSLFSSLPLQLSVLVLQDQINSAAVTVCKKCVVAYQSCTKPNPCQGRMGILCFTPISEAELLLMTVAFFKGIMFQLFLREGIILSTSKQLRHQVSLLSAEK